MLGTCTAGRGRRRTAEASPTTWPCKSPTGPGGGPRGPSRSTWRNGRYTTRCKGISVLETEGRVVFPAVTQPSPMPLSKQRQPRLWWLMRVGANNDGVPDCGCIRAKMSVAGRIRMAKKSASKKSASKKSAVKKGTTERAGKKAQAKKGAAYKKAAPKRHWGKGPQAGPGPGH